MGVWGRVGEKHNTLVHLSILVCPSANQANVSSIYLVAFLDLFGSFLPALTCLLLPASRLLDSWIRYLHY